MSATFADPQLETKLIDYRRRLHEFPELAYEEYETTKMLKQWVLDAGIELAELPMATGTLAVIRGSKPGPVIALRTDIDALPIQEQTGLPFASKIAGKMHACGHDFHMASIIGAALLLQERRTELAGTVKIIFQPAEENGTGALDILKTGVLNDVQAIFGMHDMPQIATGMIGIKAGALMAGVDRFTIDIKGTGTHAAIPEKGIDAILVASHIMTALQSIVARNISPLEQAVVSVTRLEAGNTWNVLPQTAQLEGTVRTFRNEISDQIAERMRRIIHGIAEGLGAKAELHYTKLGAALRNNTRLAEWAIASAQKAGLEVVTPEPSFAGEDFADYMDKIPGAFFFMGVSGNSDLHQPDLIIDEKAILPAAKFFATLAADMLNKVPGLREGQ